MFLPVKTKPYLTRLENMARHVTKSTHYLALPRFY